jgi:hypothetical protein
MSVSTQTLKQKVYRHFKEFLFVALYLWVVFGLLELHKSMILAEHHIHFVYHGLAFINAWALAKVMILVRHLHWGEQFDEAPLIYPTLLKAALFTSVLAFFKISEDAIIGSFRGKSFHQSMADLGGGT